MADVPPPNGLVLVLEQSRGTIARYLRAHGAGEAADDLMQELSLRLAQHRGGPVASPLSYIYRVATNLMIDFRRSQGQAARRDRDWADSHDRGSDAVDPSASAERQLDARAKLASVEDALATLSDRARRILIMHRVEGNSQRDIARDLGISISTVEADLRVAYAAIAGVRETWDKAERQ